MAVLSLVLRLKPSQVVRDRIFLGQAFLLGKVGNHIRVLVNSLCVWIESYIRCV